MKTIKFAGISFKLLEFATTSRELPEKVFVVLKILQPKKINKIERDASTKKLRSSKKKTKWGPLLLSSLVNGPRHI